MSDSGFARWLPLVTVCLAMLSLYFLASGINVVIAKVVSDLNTNVGTVQLSLVMASLVSGSLMITAGKLGNKIGKKKTLLIGLIIFFAGTMLALLSPNATLFIFAWGIVWPLGMVLIVPTTVAMVTYYYEGADRAAAFGIYGAVASAAVTLGPLLVGFLAEVVSWRLAMTVSPILTVITVLVALSIPETDKDEGIRIDYPGVFLSFAGMALFLIGMLMAGRYGFVFEKRPFEIGGSVLPLGGLSIVAVLTVISAVLLFAFIRRNFAMIEEGREPLLDPRLFANSVFTAGLLAQTVLYLIIPGIAFMLPLFLQAVNGFSPSETALTMLPGTATMALVAFFTPGLGKKVAPKYIVIAGFFLAFVSTFLIVSGLGDQTGEIDLRLPLVVFGAGGGLVMSQLANITLSAVKPEETGEASGLSETFKEAIGGGFGVAIISTLSLALWFGAFVDKQAELEGRVLDGEQRAELILQIEDQINDSGSVTTSTYYKNMQPETQARFAGMDFASGRDAIATTMWMIRALVIAAILLCMRLPATRLE